MEERAAHKFGIDLLTVVHVDILKIFVFRNPITCILFGWQFLTNILHRMYDSQFVQVLDALLFKGPLHECIREGVVKWHNDVQSTV